MPLYIWERKKKREEIPGHVDGYLHVMSEKNLCRRKRRREQKKRAEKREQRREHTSKIISKCSFLKFERNPAFK
jgi:hypothetical protein